MPRIRNNIELIFSDKKSPIFHTCDQLAERVVGVVVYDVAGGVDDLANRPEAIVQVEIAISREVAIMLSKYLAIAVYVGFRYVHIVVRNSPRVLEFLLSSR